MKKFIITLIIKNEEVVHEKETINDNDFNNFFYGTYKKIDNYINKCSYINALIKYDKPDNDECFYQINWH